ncbi:MAG: hypothetical protein KJ749_08845, partial [Planctomycetes bacterium]|nr:hypothetical protein [Planctomycetota bacterium]
MKPKPQRRDAFELFQAHFDQILNPGHELILLANKIDWSSLEAAFVDSYCPDFGAPTGARPYRRVMLVFALDSSRKTKCSRSAKRRAM